MASSVPASTLDVRRATSVSDAEIEALADVLIDCVDGGASVSFMLPMTRDKALAFWRSVADGVARGERVLLLAEDAQGIVGTVQVILAQPENQPHRADVAKMLVHRRARRQGAGAALMRAAEREALAEGKTLLVLDTADDTAARLYARLGWQAAGTIPRYALLPAGGECATTYFYRSLT
ncbi:GNAT family N-acetyltransferase [Scleromatobacter humisilvae]|uniref:GNAT family N-acetyltransferase n=1 Tax=Scleromatobacter humisilvae TaxID=2897159 RepID=A0A9X2C4C7_9BURK|nr:GNAT family N-acetyltransferase [Scleromatobacter humisilvae]MCK9689165.1 GNAT family N-acetyltransferase [Scleromatobacter humisilvae]